MKRIPALVVLGLVLMPSVAVAQRGAADLKPEQAAQMYEDIEIMRRLLLRGLGTSTVPALTQAQYFPQTANANPSAQWMSSTLANAAWPRVPAAVEGVHVKGQGVLFTLTLPATSRDPRPDGTRPPAKPDTEWERTRNQLRGQKVETTDAPDRKEPTVGDRILAVLAKNGYNFSNLAGDESITVVVVFRPDGSRTGAFSVQWAPSALDAPASRNVGGQTARDHELLGDLHLKNGKTEQAIEAYAKALTTLGLELTKPVTEVPRTTTGVEELYDKLVQALSKAGRVEEAKKVLERIGEWKTKIGKARPSPLPARLILSASKRLLDQVGNEKISFEEFKKAASVEYLTFPASAKQGR